jgi:hypothetical protein
VHSQRPAIFKEESGIMEPHFVFGLLRASDFIKSKNQHIQRLENLSRYQNLSPKLRQEKYFSSENFISMKEAKCCSTQKVLVNLNSKLQATNLNKGPR